MCWMVHVGPRQWIHKLIRMLSKNLDAVLFFLSFAYAPFVVFVSDAQ